MQDSKRIKNRSLASLLTLILAVAMVSETMFSLTLTGGTGIETRMWVNPPISLVYINETNAANVEVSNVTNLYGFEFKLAYNTTFLDAIQVGLGQFLNPPHAIVKLEINDSLGFVRFAAKSVSPAEPVNGSGTLATITFVIEGDGDAILDLYDTKLVDFYGSSISHEAMDGHLHTTIKDIVEYVLSELFVEFYENVTEKTINETISRLGTRVRGSTVLWGLGDYFKIYWLKIVSNRTVWETVYLFLTEPTVKSAEPIFPEEPLVHKLYPNDPLFPEQWGLLNAGQVTVAKEIAGPNVVTGDPDERTRLIVFMPNETHRENTQVNGAYDRGEFIYLDSDNDSRVSAGDIRLTPITYTGPEVTPKPPTFAAGSIVVAGDHDKDYRLVAFKNSETHDELVNANGRYDYGEWVYSDFDNNGHVSAGDVRLLACGTIDADIDMPQAWSLINQCNLWRNDNPVVAIIDTGADRSHPDLAPNLLWVQHQDDDGHGTHVAGIIGAVGNNRRDIAGVNWHAQIISYRWNFIVNMINIILLKHLRLRNIGVVNYSARHTHRFTIGGRDYTFNRYDQQARNVIDTAGRLDILFVTAAGNDAVDVDVGEYIYRDLDNNNKTSAGDVRLTEVTAFHPGPAHPCRKDATRTYGAGTVVAPGDWDDVTSWNITGLTPTGLITFATEDLNRNGVLDARDPTNPNDVNEDRNGNGRIDPVELYNDTNRDGIYSPDEPIYYDRDSSGNVSRGDMRLKPPQGMHSYTLVNPNDTDVGTVLTRFADNEKHVDNKHIDGRPRRVRSNRLYDGPGIYPACYALENIVSVAASNHIDHIADFSNYGKFSVDLAAPGEDIISLAISAPGQCSNVTVMSGTSMAAPHVTGAASLAFAMFPWRTAIEVKYDILLGQQGIHWPCVPDPRPPPPASGVDRRPPFGAEWKNQTGHPQYYPILVSDGRLRWPYTGDMGDAPHSTPRGGNEEYDTIASLGGALHWDTGNEWFGFLEACTNEVEVTWESRYDEDQTPNLPCTVTPNLDVQDHPNPPNFWFNPPPPWVPGQQVTVYYYVSTNYLGVNDAEGGRYHSIPSRMIYVNGFFDWNWNNRFDPIGEHAVHQPHDLSLIRRAGARRATSPPRTSVLQLSSTFIAQSSYPRWIRFRLDYGEDVGSVDPNPPIPDPPSTTTAWGLPGFLPERAWSAWKHKYRARFGEVEDWPLCLNRPLMEWAMFGCDQTRARYTISAGPCTNNMLWIYTTGGAIYSSPTVAEGKVFVGSSDKKIYAIDAETGTLVWNYTTGNWVNSSPAVADGRVFVGSWDGKLYALNATTGKSLWTYTTGDAIISSPAIFEGKVFVGSSDKNLYALHAATGMLAWKYTVGDWIDSSPAIAEGKVFFGSWDGYVYALNATTGKLVWKYGTGGAIVSSPAVVENRLYIGSMNGKIYCLDAQTGSLKWNYTTKGPIKGSPAVTCGKVFFGSYDGNVYALNSELGSLVWKCSIGAPLYSSPAVACKRKVYIASLSETPSIPLNYTFSDSKEDLIYIYTGQNVSKIYLPYLDVVESAIQLTNETLEYRITVNGGIPPLNYTTFWTVLMDRNNDPKDNCPYYPTEDADSMYSIIYDAVTRKWKIERAIYQTWGWDVVSTKATWAMTSAYPNGKVIIHISIPLGEMPEFLPGRIPWKVKTETFNGASIGDLAPNEGLAYLSVQHAKIYSLDAQTGSVLWTYETESQLYSSPAVSNGTLFIGSFDGKLYAFRSVHDVAIIDAAISKNIVAKEGIVNVNVTIQNKGYFHETIDVFLCTNSTVTNIFSVSLDKGSSDTLHLTWNASNFQKGNYTITAIANMLTEETKVGDNRLTCGWIIVAMLGDISGPQGFPDGKVDMRDVGTVAKIFGINYPDPRYNPNYDILYDLKIDMKDISIVAKNFGKAET